MPDDFDKLLETMRSREISVSIIIQNLAQLKTLFEKQWESIVGNCDEFLYLGGNEQSTHKYVSELLGKETIDTNTYGQSCGRNGNYSTNYQLAGRELMTPDEVRMLDNQYALLFVHGERPIKDLKYDVMKHPNVHLTTDGGAPAYDHGSDTLSHATIDVSRGEEILKQAQDLDVEGNFVVFCEEELEEIISKIGDKDQTELTYTSDTKLKKRLLEYAAKFPDLCQQTNNDEQGGLRFEIDKSRISIRLTAPYSEARRKAASDLARKYGF